MILTRSSNSCGEQVFLASRASAPWIWPFIFWGSPRITMGTWEAICLSFRHKLVAAHLRHGMVGQNEVNLVVGEERDGFLAVGGR